MPSTARADANLFRMGMRHMAATVVIVAAEFDGEQRGLTVTSACSLSLYPPSLLICVNHQSAARPLILQSGRFSMNLLSAEQEELARRFSIREPSERTGRFALGTWTRLVTGAPILLGTVVNFDCALLQPVDFTTHDIFIGEVRAVRVDPDRRPLLYADRRYRTLG